MCVCVCDFHCRLIDLYCCPGKRADARYCDVRDKSNASRFIDDRSGCGVSSYRSLGGRAVLSTIAEMRTAIKLNDRQAGPAATSRRIDPSALEAATTPARRRHDAARLPGGQSAVDGAGRRRRPEQGHN